MGLVGNSLPVVLAKLETTIYFTKRHLADLKVVLSTDEDDADQTSDNAMEGVVLAKAQAEAGILLED